MTCLPTGCRLDTDADADADADVDVDVKGVVGLVPEARREKRWLGGGAFGFHRQLIWNMNTGRGESGWDKVG